MVSGEKPRENAEEISWSCWLRTIFAGIGPIWLMIFVGIQEAQSSVMLPQLRKEDSFIRVTPDQETWIASLGVIMAPISSLIIGPFLDAFGRKKGLQFFFLNTSLGYGVMFCAQEVHHIYIGRIITGIGTGLMVCSVVYLVEICTKKQREYMFSVEGVTIPTGVLLMSIIGGYLSWHIATLIFSLASFLLFIVQCFIPESPPWLFKKGEEEAAVRNFRKLGRSEAAIWRELDTMRLLCKDDREKVNFRTFLAPTVWKPCVIIVASFFLQSATGIFDFLYYSVDFVERLGTTYNSLDVAVLMSCTRLAACVMSSMFFRRIFSRRFSMVLSSVGMAVALFGLAVYEYVLRDVNVAEKPFQWFLVACLLLNMAACVLGMLFLPWLMSGEVYPLRVRGAMTGVSHLAGHAFVFLSVQSYHMSIDALQPHGLLFAFAAFSFVAIFFGIYILPETQNKTLQEIEQGFLPKKKRRLTTGVQQIASIT